MPPDRRGGPEVADGLRRCDGIAERFGASARRRATSRCGPSRRGKAVLPPETARTPSTILDRETT